MQRFEGRSIRLRAMRAEDWELFYRWNQEDDWSNAEDLVPFPQSAERTRTWAESETTRRPSGDEFRFIIETLGGEAVGTIDTNHCDPHAGTFAYGIAISREHRRQGYARDAISMMLRFYFDERRYQRAWTWVYSYNEASIQLHDSMGFVREGTARRAIFRQGKYHDNILFGMTVEEFQARYGAQ